MEISEEETKKALDKAYKNAGHNAYFGNGFHAGVQFVLDKVEEQKKDIDKRLENICSNRKIDTNECLNTNEFSGVLKCDICGGIFLEDCGNNEYACGTCGRFPIEIK